MAAIFLLPLLAIESKLSPLPARLRQVEQLRALCHLLPAQDEREVRHA